MSVLVCLPELKGPAIEHRHNMHCAAARLKKLEVLWLERVYEQDCTKLHYSEFTGKAFSFQGGKMNNTRLDRTVELVRLIRSSITKDRLIIL